MEMKLDSIEEGFEQHNAEGYVTEQLSVRVIDGVAHISPAYSIERCRECGFAKGTRLRFIDRNGRDYDRANAREKIGDMIVTVSSCHIDSWSSDYVFEEVEGKFNTVMFEPEEMLYKRLAEALVDTCDDSYTGYRSELTRLVDNERTYTVTCNGQTREFPTSEAGYEWINEVKRKDRIDDVMSVLRDYVISIPREPEEDKG